MDLVENILVLVEIYVGIGVLFAAIFFWRGQDRLGHAVTDATWGFRIIIVPSLVGLWPLLIWPLRHSSHTTPWPGGQADRPFAPGFLSRLQLGFWLVLLVLVPAGLYIAVEDRANELSPREEVSELDNLVKQGGH